LYPNIFLSQTQWIVANKDALNIAFVSHYGDCVQNGDQFESEWQNADAALNQLETVMLPDGIPFGVAVGNHDQTPVGNADGTTNFYNQYFGEARFTGRTYYGGHYGSNNDNHYEYFSASGLDFIIINLEYDNSPDQVILDWADNLLTTHANRRAIVITHHLLGSITNSDSFSVQGQAIYDALKDHSNLFLLLGGHIAKEGQRTDIDNGNSVHSLLASYASRMNGGDGWLRIHEFVPASNVIYVKTYSPYIDQYETDGDSQFSLIYNMTESIKEPFSLLTTINNVTSENTAYYSWKGLNGGSTYQWYVEVDDGSTTTTGQIWSFSTDAVLSAELSSFTAQVPQDFAMEQNYPNPFNPTTTIKYHIPELRFVTLKIFNLLGEELITLVSEKKPIGSYEVKFDGKSLPSGTYFYRFQAGDFIEIKKMILVK
jgi:hypothetical protein